MIFNRVNVTRSKHDGAITFGGIDMGGRGEVVSEAGDIIVVRFPASTGWAGRGCRRTYCSPQIFVLQQEAMISPAKTQWYKTLITWEVKRKKKETK